jgi:hypothetical protein
MEMPVIGQISRCRDVEMIRRQRILGQWLLLALYAVKKTPAIASSSRHSETKKEVAIEGHRESPGSANLEMPEWWI